MEEFNKLKTEDQDFYTYLSLNALRSNNAISPEDLKKLEEIVAREPRSKDLEDLYNKVMNKQSTIDEYTKKYEKYKTELESSVKNTLSGKEEPKEEPKKELSDESKGILEYFKYEIKRVDTPLTEEESTKLESLRTSIQKVRTLEAAHKKVETKEIPTQVLKTLREKYKKEIKDEIASLGLNEKELIPDDTAIYAQLEEIEKKEVPKEVTKSSLTDIKKVFDIKKKEFEEEDKKKEIPNNDNLYDDIATQRQKVATRENRDSREVERLRDENSILKEKVDLLKTKIEFLEEQLDDLKSKSNVDTGKGKIPKNYVELARYYQLDFKRVNNDMTDEELEELRRLTKGNNKMINEIENVVRMKANGELSIKEYKEEHAQVYNKYKKMLEDVVRESKEKTR